MKLTHTKRCAVFRVNKCEIPDKKHADYIRSLIIIDRNTRIGRLHDLRYCPEIERRRLLDHKHSVQSRHCIRYRQISELQGALDNTSFVLVKIGTDYNVADAFTKVLDVLKFETFTAYILGEA